MHLQTFTGRQVAPLAPKASDFVIDDIAHALSHLCRFGGHVRTFYSVAQHSVLVSRAVPREMALWGLLHDASEAYLIDLPTPVKSLGALQGYRTVEALIQRTIYQAFGLSGDEPDEVRHADTAMLVLEARALFTPAAADRIEASLPADGARRLPNFTITPVTSERAKAGFLKRFEELTAKGPA